MRGKGKKSPTQKLFELHRNGAIRGRGLEFHFTFEEWVNWWKWHLGSNWIEKRGRKKHQYVMARKGDKGPYAPWNVKCITQSENAREQTKKVRTAKLTEEQVRSIYQQVKAQPYGLLRKLAKQHGVSRWTIKAIRNKEMWSQVTDPLD